MSVISVHYNAFGCSLNEAGPIGKPAELVAGFSKKARHLRLNDVPHFVHSLPGNITDSLIILKEVQRHAVIGQLC